MRSLRIFVLVVMAALLPVRGAVAVAMFCPGDAGAGTVAAGHDHHAAGMQGGNALHADPDGDAADDSTHASRCHACVSGCCAATIVGAAPTVDVLPRSAAVVFPALSAPVPAFESDGPERPPRSI